jgi:hypothetical protein
MTAPRRPDHEPNARTGPSDTELALVQSIMALCAGHTAEDCGRALATCLGMVVGHEHHEEGDARETAELTLARAHALSLAVLRASWGRIVTERVM